MNNNSEYYFLMSRTEHFFMLQYAGGGVASSMEVFDDEALDDTLVRKLIFMKPIPARAKLGDFHFLGEQCPVISGRLKRLLESKNLKGVQFLPALICDKKGKEHQDYYIVHLHNLIPCMDKEKSVWSPSDTKPGRAYEIRKLVLNQEALDKIPLQDRRVFAVWENILKVLYHRSIVEEILEMQFTGLTAWPV